MSITSVNAIRKGRICLSVLLVLSGFSILYGQYANKISYPDKSQEKIENMDDWSYKLATTITSHDLRDHIYTLASDQFGGRETGSRGNNEAAEYIANQFEAMDLPILDSTDGFFQKVDLTFTSWKKINLSIEGDGLKFLRDYIAFPQWSENVKWTTDEVIFLGYGIDDPAYSDYKNIDVRDKVVIVFDGEPEDTLGNSLITGDQTKSTWSQNWSLKSAAAKEYGAKLLIICSNNLVGLINENRRFLVNRVTQLGNFKDYRPEGANTIFLSPAIAEKLLGSHRNEVILAREAHKKDRNSKILAHIPQSLSVQMEVKKTLLSSQNILGYIEGGDLKEELVILSAHYDHIGQRGKEVFYGADDNASGTSTVLEIAEALATAKKLNHPPRRSVLCLLMTGEEKGLLGSAYYVAHPSFPLSQTVADVNIDMVGRRGKEYENNSEPYVYVIGSDRISQDLHKLNETTNQLYTQLVLDYTYNDEADPNKFYYRSDHYNFAKMGIPSIFFFNGVHADYHRLTDTPDKIDFPLLTMRARHIFHTTWSLANTKEPIRVRTDTVSN